MSKKPNISFVEFKYYIDRMFDVLILVSKKDTKNNEFIQKNVKAITYENNQNRNTGLSILAGIAGVGILALRAMANNSYLTQQVIKKQVKKLLIQLIKKDI